MPTWTQSDQLELLTLVIQQTQPKVDWNSIGAKMGKTAAAVS